MIALSADKASGCSAQNKTVLEECDSANEFFFDEKEEKLYYFFNNTKPTGKEEWVATKTRVLFNLTGTKDEPVTDVTIKGVTMRDTRITYLDPHGMPSGTTMEQQDGHNYREL